MILICDVDIADIRTSDAKFFNGDQYLNSYIRRVRNLLREYGAWGHYCKDVPQFEKHILVNYSASYIPTLIT